MSLEAFQKGGWGGEGEVYLAPVTELEGSFLNVCLGRPERMPVTKKEKPVFPLEPHTPQGRNPVRGSEFHENEPQSLHRWIQISQLHVSESSPLPLLPTTAPGPNLLHALLCTSWLRVLADSPGVHAGFGPTPQGTAKGAPKPRVAELRLQSGSGSFHIAPPSPVLLGSEHQGSGYRAISKFPPCAKGRRKGAAQWVRSHLLCVRLCVLPTAQGQ